MRDSPWIQQCSPFPQRPPGLILCPQPECCHCGCQLQTPICVSFRNRTFGPRAPNQAENLPRGTGGVTKVLFFRILCTAEVEGPPSPARLKAAQPPTPPPLNKQTQPLVSDPLWKSPGSDNRVSWIQWQRKSAGSQPQAPPSLQSRSTVTIVNSK